MFDFEVGLGMRWINFPGSGKSILSSKGRDERAKKESACLHDKYPKLRVKKSLQGYLIRGGSPRGFMILVSSQHLVVKIQGGG